MFLRVPGLFLTADELNSHFGPLHIHGWAPHPKNGPPEQFVLSVLTKWQNALTMIAA